MIFLIILLVLVTIYELPGLIKQKLLKETFIFIELTIITLIIGYIYFSDPLVDTSILKILMSTMGLK